MSSLWDVVKTVGSQVIANVVPGGSMLMGVVNELLPDDKKLPAGATGDDVQTAINSLPAADRARIMEKEIDVDLTTIRESHSTLRTALEMDAANPHSTRPYIAKHSFHVIAFTTVVTISLWAYGIYKADTAMVDSIVDGWPFLLAAIGPLVVLLHAYFGVLKQEQKNKLDAAGGKSGPSGIAGIISAVLKK